MRKQVCLKPHVYTVTFCHSSFKMVFRRKGMQQQTEKKSPDIKYILMTELIINFKNLAKNSVGEKREDFR